MAPWSNPQLFFKAVTMQSVDAVYCKVDFCDGVERTGSRWQSLGNIRDPWDIPLWIGCGGDAYPPILIRKQLS